MDLCIEIIKVPTTYLTLSNRNDVGTYTVRSNTRVRQNNMVLLPSPEIVDGQELIDDPRLLPVHRQDIHVSFMYDLVLLLYDMGRWQTSQRVQFFMGQARFLHNSSACPTMSRLQNVLLVLLTTCVRAFLPAWAVVAVLIG